MSQLPRKLGMVARRLAGAVHPVILAYHRVAKEPIDPWELAVEPDNFYQHMQMLAESRTVVPLSWLVDELRAGRRPQGAVAITFDDAYRDVLTAAKPILVRHNFPATVFAVTGALGSPDGYWWDVLSASVYGAVSSTSGISLSFLQPREQICFSGAEQKSGALHLLLWQKLRTLEPSLRDAAIQEIRAAMPGAPTPNCPVMSCQDLRELVTGGLVSVEAHTVSHPSLPHLGAAAQAREVRQCRAELERILGFPVRGLAYPFGDFDARCERTLIDEGFHYGLTTMPGPARDPQSIFRLPRFHIKNWTDKEFRRRLAWMR